MGEESLRYALVILGPGFPLGSWHACRASKTVARDLQRAQGRGDDASEEHEISAQLYGEGTDFHETRGLRRQVQPACRSAHKTWNTRCGWNVKLTSMPCSRDR